MKRLLIAVSIVLCILASSFWSLWQFSLLRQEAEPLFQTMEQALAQQDAEASLSASQQFLQLWKDYEQKLIPFVRQDPLEVIGGCAARLPALAEHQAAADFAATLRELRYRMDELWDSELPIFRNLI